jgi:tRNA pseudouridine55 synthase
LGQDTRPGIDPGRLQEIFSHYRGTILQTLPPYSAKKVRGRPLYSYARKGIDITPPTKEITIKSLTLHGVEKCEVDFELACTAGTYARSLAHDIGKEYGCGAHLVRLRRIRSGEFPIEKAVPLSGKEQFQSGDFFLNRIIPIKDLLHEIPSIVIQDSDRNRLLHGMDLNLLTAEAESEEFRLIDESGEIIAFARRVQTFMSPVAQPAHWIRLHPHITFG